MQTRENQLHWQQPSLREDSPYWVDQRQVGVGPASVRDSLCVLMASGDQSFNQEMRSALIGFYNLQYPRSKSLSIISAAGISDVLGQQSYPSTQPMHPPHDPNYDLAIVGMRRDGLHGARLIRVLKEEQPYRSQAIPIIAVGEVASKSRFNALGAGADVYLSTPVEMVSLFGAFFRLLV